MTPALVYYMSHLKQPLPSKKSESAVIKHSKDERKYSQVQYYTDRITPDCFLLRTSQAKCSPTKTRFASVAALYWHAGIITPCA